MTEFDKLSTKDTGHLLVKVQEDIALLKDRLLRQNPNELDLRAIQEAIELTEKSLKEKAELLSHKVDSEATSLRNFDQNGQKSQQVTIEELQVLHAKQGPSATSYAMVRSDEGQHIQPVAISANIMAPGRRVVLEQKLRAMLNPANPKSRDVLNEAYGIQLPLIEHRQPRRDASRVITGSTVDKLAVIPVENRRDPLRTPPPITDDDARRGILNLSERGLIPLGAKITLEPTPVVPKPITLHEFDESRRDRKEFFRKKKDALAGVHLDVKTSVTRRNQQSGKKSREARRVSSAAAAMIVTEPTMDDRLQLRNPMPPPTTPATDAIVVREKYRFSIYNGEAKENTKEFIKFKQHYCIAWGSIATIIRKLEQLLGEFSVPLGLVDGERLADLAAASEVDPTLVTPDELLKVIMNRDDVIALMKNPGRRYLTSNGQERAATTIQSKWRAFKARKAYLHYRRQKWAASIIALSWLMMLKVGRIRRQLKQTRIEQLDAFRKKFKTLGSKWKRIKKSRRVVIHMPSLGLPHSIRKDMLEIGKEQNMQMSRLCDLMDPNVDIIYICPMDLDDEMRQYYSKLLTLDSAIRTVKRDGQKPLSERYTFVVPEALNSFPKHKMSLATLLKYSPKSLKRIKQLIQGREAYIMPGVISKDDLYVAETLGVSILGSEPEVAHLYSSKSGSKRIFQHAGVTIPPGEFDIYSLNQLQDALAQLITDNLDVKRWLLKLDHQTEGRGIAYFDVTNMSCYLYAKKQAERYGREWANRWAQEQTYSKIYEELPIALAQHAKPVCQQVYKTWDKFLDEFLSEGGILEACPPTDEYTALTVNILIEPDGSISTICSGDQIHADCQYSCWGFSIPQTSVSPNVINEVCQRIASACRERRIFGYVDIDFITFLEPGTDKQTLWATDLDIAYRDLPSLFNTIHFMSNGTFDSANHEMRVNGTEERFAVVSNKLRHTNLTLIHYGVFFQMCRAHGIGFDIKEKQGTVFNLIDDHNRDSLSMVVIGANLQETLATFARNLSLIHQEISTPNMQGVTNFKAVIKDIEGILGTTAENALDLE